MATATDIEVDDNETIDLNEQRQEAQADDSDEIVPEVREDPDGETRVEVPKESGRQKRIREAVEATTKPLFDKIASLEKLLQQRVQPAQMLPYQPQQPTRQEQPDPDDVPPEILKANDELVRIQKALQVAIANQDSDEIKSLSKEWQSKDYKRQQMIAKSVAAESVSQLRRELPPAPEMPLARIIRNDYPEILQVEDKAELLNYAQSLFTQEAVTSKRSGKKVNEEALMRDSLDKAAQVWGIRQPKLPKPSQGAKEKLNGRGNTPGARSSVGGFKLTEHEKIIAMAAAPDGMSEKEAYSSWVRNVLRTNPSYFDGR